MTWIDNGEALKRRSNELCPGGGGTLRRGAARSSPSNVDDLIHLAGPLTEDAVLKTLQARFYADEFFVRLNINTNLKKNKNKRKTTSSSEIEEHRDILTSYRISFDWLIFFKIERQTSDRSCWLSILTMKWATRWPCPARAISSKSRNWCASSKKRCANNRKRVILKPSSCPDVVARVKRTPRCSSYGNYSTWPAADPKRTPSNT